MAKAKIFRSGNCQAVRLPKAFRFDVDELEILRRGQDVILRKPPRKCLSAAFELLASLPDDFMEGDRKDRAPQRRRADP